MRRKAQATPEALLNLGIYDPDQKAPDVRRWLNAEAYPARADHDHRHGGHAQVGHGALDVNRHDARIRAFCIRHDVPLSAMALDLFIELLRGAHGPKLLRRQGDRGAGRRSVTAPDHPRGTTCVSSSAAASGVAGRGSRDPDRFYFAGSRRSLRRSSMARRGGYSVAR